MNRMLAVTTLVEAGAGAFVLAFPSLFSTLLLGAPLDTSAAATLARLGGAGLVALGLSCWFARGDELARGTRGLAMAMACFHVAAVLIFMTASLVMDLHSLFLWPAALLHAVLAIWTLACLWSVRRSDLGMV